MTEPPLVVVVAYRSDDHLRACLSALDGRLDVVVVDNDAASSTRQLCLELGARYLGCDTNVGFAAAVNRGLSLRGHRDVLLLNPDATIESDAVVRLQQFLHDSVHRRAAVGPALMSHRGAERASWPMPSPAQAWAEALGLARWWRGRRFITGAVLMLRGEALEELGGLDERYFLYAEESDWQQRAQNAGWEVAVAGDLTAHHVGGASSSDSDRRDFHFITSARLFARRWHGTPGAAVMRGAAMAAALRRATVGPDRAVGRRRLRQSVRLPRPGDFTPRRSVTHIVCTDSFAGVERSVVDLAGEQHARGWLVSVVGGDQDRMRGALPPGIMVLPGATLASAYRSLARLGRVDVVHAHMTKAELVAVALKGRTGARVIATRHFAATRGSTTIARPVGRLIARRIDAELAISEFVAGAAELGSHVVRNGVTASAATTVGPRQKSVVLMQRLEAEKHTSLALDAWSLSDLPAMGWSMRVFGRGAQLETLEKRARELGCADTITFEGFADDPRDVLAAAGIFFASAPAEPFGLAVAEAMAEGTPVVGADGGAHREVGGTAAAYFPVGDAAAAAERLNELAALSDTQRLALGDRLRARQADLLTVSRQVDDLMPHYLPGPRVVLLSLEAWDDTWRRNQHLATRVVKMGFAHQLVFVTPPRGGLAVRSQRSHPRPGITVVTPPLIVPRRWGGHRLLAAWLRRTTRRADVLWINDPVAGDAARRPDLPAIYDVTDDWRTMDQPAADRRRIVAAEDRLAGDASTVVCSETLAARWRERYGVGATLIGNGVDVDAIRAARPRQLTDPAPHLVYVGTLHPNRIDTALLEAIADLCPGTLHLVGPDGLPDDVRARLDRHGVRRHGPVASDEVPSWLATADVLVCPHVVDEFTLSLDAIKAYEYLATSAPIVATPSSGFQALDVPGLQVVPADGFVEAVMDAIGSGPFARAAPASWDERAAEFGRVLAAQMAQSAAIEGRP